jgi:RimJ/RimL family protein N-acetyltransferase
VQAPVIETERLLLRAFTGGDIDAIYQACQDPDIQQWTSVPVPYRREDARAVVEERYPQGFATDTAYIFGAFRKDTNALVSTIGVIARLHNIWEIGYWTAAPQRGYGFTQEATAGLVRWTFATLPVQRIEWQGMVGNPRSWSVAEKVGFRFEGVLRAGFAQRGVAKDIQVGGLLPSDLG